jgi:hypothetical protein
MSKPTVKINRNQILDIIGINSGCDGTIDWMQSFFKDLGLKWDNKKADENNRLKFKVLNKKKLLIAILKHGFSINYENN